MSRRVGKTPSQRQLRVGEELRHALAAVLERGDVRDPGLKGASVTVTEVRISPDLRNATAFVLPLGGGDATGVVAALNRARPFLRRRMAGDVKLRYAPDISFLADTSFDRAVHIEALLRDPRSVADPADSRGEDEAT